jgi:hypothetical protein
MEFAGSESGFPPIKSTAKPIHTTELIEQHAAERVPE